MKHPLALVLFLALSAHAAQRSVEIQWEETPGADQYQVEVRAPGGGILKKFTSKGALLQFKAPIGRFELRARVLTKEGRFGEWSEWTPLEVPPKEVAFSETDTTAVSTQVPLGKDKGVVKLTWPKEETAARYLVKIFKSDGELLGQKAVSLNELTLSLPAGEYSYSVTSLGPKGFQSTEARSPQPIQVGEAPPPDIKITERIDEASGAMILEWQPHKLMQIRQRVEYQAFLAEEWRELKDDILPSDQTSWTAGESLRPGHYKIIMSQELEGRAVGKPFEKQFTLKPNEKSLDENLQNLNALLGE